MRVKRGVAAKKRHKKWLKLAQGYKGRRKSVFRLAKQAVIKAGQYRYRHRRERKRTMRRLWIARINAGARSEGLRYSEFIAGLKIAKIELDRKQLQLLAQTEPEAFKTIVMKAKDALAEKSKTKSTK